MDTLLCGSLNQLAMNTELYGKGMKSESSLVPKELWNTLHMNTRTNVWSQKQFFLNELCNVLQVLDLIIMWSIGALHANIGAIKPTSKDSIVS